MLPDKLLRYVFFAGILSLVSVVKAQDPEFSQFYANPLYLNPAMAGTAECARINLNYRNQWPSLTKAFITYNISYDQNLSSINSGFGMLVTNDRQGDGALNTTMASLIYTYNLQVTQGLYIRFGVKGTYYQQRLDWDKLIFADQINPINGSIDPVSDQPPPEKSNISTVDFSAGTVLNYYDKFMIGFAADHLTQPDISFYDNSSNKLLIRYTVHGGVAINLSRGTLGHINYSDIALEPHILYMRQGDFQQINGGLYVTRKPVVLGVWFRHNFQNPDAVVFLVGLSFKNINFGYSYDMGVSSTGGGVLGAHEISFSWNFCILKEDKKRRIRAIKSPLF